MRNKIILISVLFIICYLFSCESTYNVFLGHRDRVSVSEVYLDTVNIKKSWIEFYNPTENDIEIVGGRYSHILTINHLPTFIVPSKEYFVLCASDSVFQKYYNKIDNVLEVPSIEYLSKDGGFFAFWSMQDSIALSDAFKYGEIAEQPYLDWIAASAKIPFLHDKHSCSLWIIGKNKDCNIYDYKISFPTPGFGYYGEYDY